MTVKKKENSERIIKKENAERGKILQNARRGKGLTQVDVCDKLGLNPRTLSSYETGRAKPSEETLTALAELYGAELKDFVPELRQPMYLNKIPVITCKKTYKDRSEVFMANDPLRFEYGDVSRPEDYIYIDAPDDAMSDHRILRNDAVLIRKNQAPVSGDIVAALIGGYIIIRAYEKLTEDSYLLKAGDVSGHGAIRVKGDVADGKEVSILGVKRLVIMY